MPEGLEDWQQHSQLLHEMDNAPRCSERARVSNTKYYNADNATLPSGQPSSVNVLNMAAALAASGTSTTLQPMPLKPAEKLQSPEKLPQ